MFPCKPIFQYLYENRHLKKITDIHSMAVLPTLAMKKNASNSLKTSENYEKQAKKIIKLNLTKQSLFHRQNQY